MADNTVKMTSSNGGATIIVTKDMVEYYTKMGYTKVGFVDTKPIEKVKNKKENK